MEVDSQGGCDTIRSMSVDTLKIVHRLQAVGVATEIAETHAEIMREAVAEHLVTKADLQETELRLKIFILKTVGGSATATIAILAALNFFVF